MRIPSSFIALPLLLTGLVAFAQDKPATEKPAAEKPAAESGSQAVDALAVSVPTFMNTNCPIMGKPSSAILYADIEQGRIYLCCPPCAKKVKKDPQRAHDAAYPTVRQAGNTVCPVTGKTLAEGAPTIVLQGVEIGVADEAAKALAPSMAQTILVKANDPQVVDLGNEVCPVTGKPVAGDAFCLIGKNLVRLSSPECVDDVKKSPAALLAKAKSLGAEAKAAKAAAEKAAETPTDAPDSGKSGSDGDADRETRGK